MPSIAFFDLETSRDGHKIFATGAVSSDGSTFRNDSVSRLLDFLAPYDFIAGHNIVAHDLPVLRKASNVRFQPSKVIDTLLLSPLLFPNKPYHKLLKDDKLQVDHLNNPVLDAEKSKQLFEDELSAFKKLPPGLQTVYASLLQQAEGFQGFFNFLNVETIQNHDELCRKIKLIAAQHMCGSAPISRLVTDQPVMLAYALSALLSNKDSLTPAWVLKNYPGVQSMLKLLANTPCLAKCDYCLDAFDARKALKRYFHYDDFRKYEGEALQENAINAALQHKSLLAIFPTGGGKSITFQLPALIAGDNGRELTVVISPLQSLMKDQVDNLQSKGILSAVAINGLLDPVERQEAIERVADGTACLLYISPESLRSNTIRNLLLKRTIARFVIDEAHCFSAWGQDFRVDYVYIGPFIRQLQKDKELDIDIPVSCFTATAKQKVIDDIREYFKKELNQTIDVFRTTARRTNLSYKVFEHDEEDDKYTKLRAIVEEHKCPTIIYVSRTKKAEEVSARLIADGFPASHFHGKMEVQDKMDSQDQFISGETDIIVATSAFGMGVDKSNVGLVVHYEISNSLENYVQEAGRAGRDEKVDAKCYVLFNEADLDIHFSLLRQSKITKQEINQIWRAIKSITAIRKSVSSSALDIARKAGWDENVKQLETRVTTAIAALEMAGYLMRGQNFPSVYATSITEKNADAAIQKINNSEKIGLEDKPVAVRIIKKLFSSAVKKISAKDEAEARVDYIADQLGIKLERVISLINAMREIGILADDSDLSAFVKRTETQPKITAVVEKFSRIENLLITLLAEERHTYNLKELGQALESNGVAGTVADIKSILHFWGLRKLIDLRYEDGSRHHITIQPREKLSGIRSNIQNRQQTASTIANYLVDASKKIKNPEDVEEVLVAFSMLELKKAIAEKSGLFDAAVSRKIIEDALFYLVRIDAMKIEGGFLVIYNKMHIQRLEENRSIQYKESDYDALKTYYEQKIAQIHIVGEYARLMAADYRKALQFVDDYFSLNSSSFMGKYFNSNQQREIKRSMHRKTFERLFGDLSVNQLAIINDADSQNILVAAGPGSGKTKVLVHKLASLLLIEEVKQEQLLMLTFSRAAATEFKSRLLKLIGSPARYVEIKTFHSYCFDLLDKMGSLEGVDNVVAMATEKILSKEIDANRFTKTVLVVDEAQDMNESEYRLVEALMQENEDMRTILVGDDDQNIYEFRGANAKFMRAHIDRHHAKKYDLVNNYRSSQSIVEFCNRWVMKVNNRLKSVEMQPHSDQEGYVEVRQWAGTKFVIPAVEAILAAELSGSTAVLTRTNETADTIVGVLKHRGRNARLIQGNDGFSLARMLEVDYFTKLACADQTDATVQDSLWSESREQLAKHYAKSSNLEMVLNMIDRFAEVNPTRKYKTDWIRFLDESKLEDFLTIGSDAVLVSTIHRAKGREFDNVFVILESPPLSQEDMRCVFVALTRAKSRLFVGYHGEYFKPVASGIAKYAIDSRAYTEPAKISITLTLRDVNLGRFAYLQQNVRGLTPGDALKFAHPDLINRNGKAVVRFSLGFQAHLSKYLERGFVVQNARVNHVVYWWDEEAKKEVKTVLAEVMLGKENH